MTARSGPELSPTYEPFARQAEYLEVNRHFVEALDLEGRDVVVDLACGTGAMTALLLQALARRPRPAGAPRPSVSALEVSDDALRLAAAHLTALPEAAGVSLSLSRASLDDLPFDAGTVDVAVLGNAIHLADDKRRVVTEVHRILRPGGLFGFNTSFYAGAYLPGTERFYLRWVQEAVRALGDSPGRRRQRVPAFSNRWLSTEEYAALVKACGFEVRHVAERTVPLSRQSFEAIGSYAGLASVLLRGYDPALARRALHDAAAPALEACGMDVVPRGWLEVSARKRAGSR
jgi:ubiquinone/menaquinone biosynthesis C-methylase UbiE